MAELPAQVIARLPPAGAGAIEIVFSSGGTFHFRVEGRYYKV
jgi:hypothetical protein